jgi:hypothetical protein
MLCILYGAKVVLPNMGSGGDYEASRIVWGMAGGWLMPHWMVGRPDPRVQLEEKRLRGKSPKQSLVQW